MTNKRTKGSCILILFVFVGASSLRVTSVCGDPGSPARTRVIEAASGSKKTAAYRELFLNATAEEMRAFEADSDTSIALQAAWERARVLVPFGDDRDKGDAEIRLDAADELFEVDREALGQFVRAAEKRLCVPIPGWWKRTLAENFAYDTGHIGFESAHDLFEMYFRRVDGKPFPLVIERSTRMTSEGTKVVLQCRSTKSAPMVIEKKGGWQAIATSCHCKTLVYAGYGDAGYPYPLICRDIETNREQWSTTVWGLWGDKAAPAAGAFWHLAMIREAEGIVAVFGVGFSGAYIEGFRMEDGASAFRFSSNYWMGEGKGPIRPVQFRNVLPAKPEGDEPRENER